jgi:soluble lytic murein transglycosylase
VLYQARAASRAGGRTEAAEALKGFATRFPRSPLRWQALELEVHSLLEAQEPQQAHDVLAAEPEARKRPQLALLLAQSYQEANQTLQAAQAFQEVYFAFPTSPQAKAAADALATLRSQLGPTYPIPTDEIQTARLEVFLKVGFYEEALKGFEALLQAEPRSPSAPHWQLERVRCLVHLHRTADALDALFNHFPAAELEAQRLALLVETHVQQADALAITRDLSELETQYSAWPAYGEALAAAGNFYYRQLNWQEAARVYQRLAELFPQSEHARDDFWRLAWCHYLLHDPRAPAEIRDYLERFPDSARAPAALYWLGRIKEEQGAPSEARALYVLLEKKFVHSYYALPASARMANLHPGQGSVASASEARADSLAAALAPLLPAPVISPRLACLSSMSSEAARPALILQALGLKDLEEEYLTGAVAGNAAPPDLRLLLARMQASANKVSGALFDTLKIAPDYSQVDFSALPEEIWDFLYPQAYAKLIERQAHASHLDPQLVRGLIRQESAFNAHALSSADARGLMQILPKTATSSRRRSRLRAVGLRLYDPTYNVRFGCTYLKELMKEFDDRPEYALAAYHAGDFRVKNWVSKATFPDSVTFLESIPIPTTRAYVEMVLRDAGTYRQLSAGSPHFAVCAESKASTPSSPAAAGPRLNREAGTRSQRGSAH